MRGYLTAFVNMCWGFGLLLSAGVVRASLELDSQWGWRIPFMIQWVWPVPLFVIACFAPESPWYLVKVGREDDARATTKRLAPSEYLTDQLVDQQIALMKHTIEMEKAETQGASFLDCFKGSNLRRTEIVMLVWIIQYWSGQNIINYATQYLQTGGMTEDGAFNMFLGITCCYIVGTAACWYTMHHFGRRSIYIAGVALMVVWHVIIGSLGTVNSTKATLAIGIVMVIINFSTNATFFPVTYTIAAEVPATRVRAKTMVLGRGVYLISSIICNQITPRMFSVSEWNWGAKSSFFWMGCCLISLVYLWFRLPETKGRMFSELDVLFANEVPARQFKHTIVDELSAVTEEKYTEKGEIEYQENA